MDASELGFLNLRTMIPRLILKPSNHLADFFISTTPFLTIFTKVALTAIALWDLGEASLNEYL